MSQSTGSGGASETRARLCRSARSASAPDVAVRSLCVRPDTTKSWVATEASVDERERLDAFERKDARCPVRDCGEPACQVNAPHYCFRHFRDMLARKHFAKKMPFCQRIGCWRRAASGSKPHLCLPHKLAPPRLARSRTK